MTFILILAVIVVVILIIIYNFVSRNGLKTKLEEGKTATEGLTEEPKSVEEFFKQISTILSKCETRLPEWQKAEETALQDQLDRSGNMPFVPLLSDLTSAGAGGLTTLTGGVRVLAANVAVSTIFLRGNGLGFLVELYDKKAKLFNEKLKYTATAEQVQKFNEIDAIMQANLQAAKKVYLLLQEKAINNSLHEAAQGTLGTIKFIGAATLAASAIGLVLGVGIAQATSGLGNRYYWQDASGNKTWVP